MMFALPFAVLAMELCVGGATFAPSLGATSRIVACETLECEGIAGDCDRLFGATAARFR